ncbi:MAG: PKD domain-containing protein [Bacteroidota bacterium]
MESTCGDIDYAAWGPFAALTCNSSDLSAAGNPGCGGNYDQPYGNLVDCAYSTAATEDLLIPYAVVGQFYMVMINNYANCTGNAIFSQTSGTGATDCSIVIPCDITNITINIGACVPSTNLYSISGQIFFNDQPTTGQLIISDGSTTQTFNAPFVSPLNYNLTGMTSDGATHTVTAYFTDEPLCSYTFTYTAPAPCSVCFTYAGVDQQVCGLAATLTGNLSAEAPATSTTGLWTGTGTFSAATSATTNVTVTQYNNYTFTLTETDNTGCTSTDNVSVIFVETPVIGFPVTSDDVCALTYNLSVLDNSTGTGTYASQGNMTGSWSSAGPGTTVTFSPSNSNPNATVTVDTYGTYTFTWNANNNGCTSSASMTVTFNPDPVFDFTTTNESCTSACDGTSSVNLISGTPPYNTNPATPMSNLCSGNYTVTLTDNNGCSSTNSFTINAANPISVTSSSSTPENCGMSNGTITISASGGSGSLTYNIGSGAVTPGNFTGLSAGAYIVTITDGLGCTITEPVAVNAIGNVTSGFTASANQCLNGNSFSFTNTGDTGGGISWTWTFTGANTPTSTLENPTGITWSTPGTYVVTQTAIVGTCNDVSSQNITVFAQPTVSVTVTDVSCNGLCDGTATATASGGTPAYSYSWNDPGSQTVQTATGLCAGTFSVTVTDSNTCTGSGSGTITQNNAIVINSESSTPVSCFGEQDGTVIISASGGASPLSYNIGTGGQASGSFSNLGAGTYTVTVTDANGCTIAGTAQTITEPTQVTAVVAGTNIQCNGELNGQADLTAGGGTPPYSFLWSNNMTIEDMTGVAANTYGVTVTDFQGCTATAFVTITEPPALQIIGPDDKYICNGQVANLTASASGGTGTLTYYWNGVPGTATYAVSPSSQTTYTVYVIDQNGCQSSTESVTVNVSPNVVLELFANETYVCPGDPAVISANIYNGVPPYYIYNSTGDVISPPVIINPYQDTTITLYVEDQCGSSASDNITIQVYPLPPVGFAANINQGCVPLSIQFNENSPDLGQSYVWNFGDNDLDNLSFSKNPSHTYDEPGVYDVTLTVTSAEGCVSQLTIWQMIHVFVGPVAKFMADPEVASIIKPIVFFENLSIDADDYTWVFGDGDTSNVVNPWHTFPIYPTGAYNVMLIAHTNKGCSDTAYKEIVIKNEITFYAPSAFSPDFDGINDFFIVKGNGIDPHNFQIYVYDRWGEVVFESDDLYQGWDGRIKGRKIGQNGAYTWLCIYRDMYGTEHQEAGAVTIIR